MADDGLYNGADWGGYRRGGITMTIDLFGVQDALDGEREERHKLKKIRARMLKRWGTEQEVIEGANNAQESHLPPEARKSSNLDESP